MTEKKNLGGRPMYKPTAEQRRVVEVMTMAGIQHDVVAATLEICKNTLYKHFRKELDLSSAKANAAVVANLYKQATKDDPRSTSAAIFWCKTQLGWRDVSEIKHSGSIGSYDLTKLSDDQLDQLATILGPAAAVVAGDTGGDPA